MPNEQSELVIADRIIQHLELNARVAALCQRRSFATLSSLYDEASDQWEQQHSRAIPPSIVGALWRSCLAVWQSSGLSLPRAA